ncbi:MAG: DUF3179 domain-containing (seleno)protein, partial [Candidatus Paceibacteria bacterium]
MRLNLFIFIVIVVGFGIIIAGQRFLSDDFNLPTSGKSVDQTITIKDGQVINPQQEPKTIDSSQTENSGQETFLAPSIETKEIMITNGVKHSIPLDAIMGGGPPKDGIPSIDHPKFISVQEASNFLSDEEPGIAIEIGKVNRFYPFQILVWHEIVNDLINDQRVLITYCPLCLSGIVFDPLVKGERVEFGTSGKLWNSNLVMYDRKTDSLWSQILGEAIVGEMTGTRLKVLPSDQMRFGVWK